MSSDGVCAVLLMGDKVGWHDVQLDCKQIAKK